MGKLSETPSMKASTSSSNSSVSMVPVRGVTVYSSLPGTCSMMLLYLARQSRNQRMRGGRRSSSKGTSLSGMRKQSENLLQVYATGFHMSLTCSSRMA